MHLDTVFTLSTATSYRVHKVVDKIRRLFAPARATSGQSSRSPRRTRSSSAVRDALGLKELRVVETGGDECAGRARAVGRRQQRRRARARRGRRRTTATTHTNTLLRKAGIEVLTIAAPSSAAAAAAATA